MIYKVIIYSNSMMIDKRTFFKRTKALNFMMRYRNINEFNLTAKFKSVFQKEYTTIILTKRGR